MLALFGTKKATNTGPGHDSHTPESNPDMTVNQIHSHKIFFYNMTENSDCDNQKSKQNKNRFEYHILDKIGVSIQVKYEKDPMRNLGDYPIWRKSWRGRTADGQLIIGLAPLTMSATELKDALLFRWFIFTV